MRITQEADYALRITSVLAVSEVPVGAQQIATEVHIPARFAMKILRKLMLKGLVKATRGATGGYSLAQSAKDISILQVVEAIDGKIEVRHCLDGGHICTYNSDKSLCRFHNVFCELNAQITQKLSSLNIADMVDPSISMETLINKIK